MNVVVKFVPSAFKHGISEENIRYAILNWIYNDIFENDSDKHLLIGFDKNANLLEILYNIIDEQNLKVFHAMECRNTFLSLLQKQEKIMPDLTDEEYDALDEYWTINTPKLSGNGKSGFFAKHTGQVVFIDNLCANWLRIKAAAKNTTPDVVIGELVRAEIARAVS